MGGLNNSPGRQLWIMDSGWKDLNKDGNKGKRRPILQGNSTVLVLVDQKSCIGSDLLGHFQELGIYPMIKGAIEGF